VARSKLKILRCGLAAEALPSVPSFLALAGTLFIRLPVALCLVFWEVWQMYVPTREGLVMTNFIHAKKNHRKNASVPALTNLRDTFSETTFVCQSFGRHYRLWAKAWIRSAQVERETSKSKQQATQGCWSPKCRPRVDSRAKWPHLVDVPLAKFQTLWSIKPLFSLVWDVVE